MDSWKRKDFHIGILQSNFVLATSQELELVKDIKDGCGCDDGEEQHGLLKGRIQGLVRKRQDRISDLLQTSHIVGVLNK